MGRRSDIDWIDIEADYRTGREAVRQLAVKHGVAESNLRARAKREGWTRSAAESARAAARNAITEVARERAAEIGARIGAQQAAKYDDVVAETALSASEVLLEHQRCLSGARRVARALLGELQAAAADDLVNGELERCLVEDPQRAALIERLLGLRGRVETFDRWAAGFSKLVAAEREAYEIGRGDQENSIDAVLKKIAEEKAMRDGSAGPLH